MCVWNVHVCILPALLVVTVYMLEWKWKHTQNNFSKLIFFAKGGLIIYVPGVTFHEGGGQLYFGII